MIDAKTGEKIRIWEKGENFAISPDNKWLAYEIDGLIQVVDVLGVSLTSLSKAKEWDSVVGWLNNQQIVVLLRSEDPDVSPSLLLLNPFTQEKQTLPPLWFYHIREAYWEGWEGRVYDSTLRHVVYLDGDGFVLQDLLSGHTTTLVYFGADAMPHWSPTGEKFALASNLESGEMKDEIYLIDLNGEVKKASNLEAYYAAHYIERASLSWSPDGRYLAFLFVTWDQPMKAYFNPAGQRYLAVLDTRLHEVVNYCIPVASMSERSSLKPVWSPDSAQIVVPAESKTMFSRLVLIDITREVASQIAEDVDPIGWLAEEP